MKVSWIVRVEVESNWIADGFDLTSERAQEWAKELLPYSISGEITATILSRPSKAYLKALAAWED